MLAAKELFFNTESKFSLGSRNWGEEEGEANGTSSSLSKMGLIHLSILFFLWCHLSHAASLSFP
jgi:hypothetical protein